MKQCAVAFFVVALAGCQVQQAEDPLVSAAKAAVVATLKDPDSVQFRDVAVVQIKTAEGLTRSVCGAYNAKNSLGGYVGYERFSWEPTEDILIAPSMFPESNSDRVNDALDAWCIRNELR